MDNESLKVYFTKAQWSSLTSYEKKHLLQVKRNYDVLSGLGLNPKIPSFMKTIKRIQRIPTEMTCINKDAEENEIHLQLRGDENVQKLDSGAKAIEQPNESCTTEQQEAFLEFHQIKTEEVIREDPCSSGAIFTGIRPVNGVDKYLHHVDVSECAPNHAMDRKHTDFDNSANDKVIFDCQIKIEPTDDGLHQDNKVSEASSTVSEIPLINGENYTETWSPKWKHDDPDDPPYSRNLTSSNENMLLNCQVKREKSYDISRTDESSNPVYTISGINVNGSKIKYFHCFRCTLVCGPRAGRQKVESWSELDEYQLNKNTKSEAECVYSYIEGKIHRACGGNQRRIKSFKCPHCDHRSIRARNLRCHVETMHIGKKPYKCELCDYRAAQRTHIKKHLDAVHFGLKRYKCSLCNYAASQTINLELHILSVHSEKKPFTCHICDYSTVRSHDLKSHIDAVHSGTKRFKCTRCQFRTAHESSMNRHMRDVHYKKELNPGSEITEIKQEC